ncbi:sensor histidine kinase [Labedaea rhizosphaerae]|uniref:Signal transduction histidine kinase n=1 Tax=Labedaea rhizosphaerae TaxID=598644 RepID=A0A4R6SCY9_LABRH|nr:ATP-binding protein [Labedaea rhizosphaerae]TDP97457.1 signal transduction histidine kinase [Labedaea rhizosphaerae]
MGSAEAEFLAAARRFAGPIRALALVLISTFGTLAVPGEHLALGLALLGFVLASAVVECSGHAVFVLAVARVLALCLTQEWIPGQWAFNALTITAITLQWDHPPKIAWPTTTGLLAVYLAVAGLGTAAEIGPRLVVECALAQLGFQLLRRSSRRVDRLRARRVELERAEALSRERRRQEREYLALLHDTASATLLMVTDGADPDRVAEYARHDLAVLTRSTTQDSPVDLGAALRSVVDRGPLTVHADLPTGLRVPAATALAVVRAVREALLNVERHAGVRTASVRAEPGVVTVRDDGIGFEPDAVTPARRGIRGSIVDRMRDAGGNATITSSAGNGTIIRLVWPDA